MPQEHSELARRSAALVRAALEPSGAPGATVALIRDGQLLFELGVGARDLDGAPLPADAQLYVYSVTKPMIAAVVLQLAEQGRLGLDDPVRPLLPDSALDPAITVRQLLNHTAGLRDYGPLPGYSAAIRADPASPWSAAEFLRATLPLGPAFPPGQGWGYSNVGYLLLRLLIERLCGASLKAVLAERIFGPLGLRRTFVAETLADVDVLAPGYSMFLDEGERPVDIRLRYHPGWVAHGVVVSTAGELARIVDAIMAGRVVGAASLSEMLTPVLVGGEYHLFRAPAYGLGLMLDAAPTAGLVAGHGGGGPGYSIGALHRILPGGARLTATVLANGDSGAPGLDTAFALLALAEELERAAPDR